MSTCSPSYYKKGKTASRFERLFFAAYSFLMPCQIPFMGITHSPFQIPTGISESKGYRAIRTSSSSHQQLTFSSFGSTIQYSRTPASRVFLIHLSPLQKHHTSSLRGTSRFSATLSRIMIRSQKAVRHNVLLSFPRKAVCVFRTFPLNSQYTVASRIRFRYNEG